MLVFSSRELVGRTAMSAMNQQLAAQSVWHAQAVPQDSPQMQKMANAPWQVMQMDCDVDDAHSMHKLLPLFQQARPLLVHLHGYHNTPAAFFERCDRLQSLYGLEIVRFSWSSKKHLSDDGVCCDVSGSGGAGVDEGLQQELQRLFGSQMDSMPAKYPAPLYPVAGGQQNLTCSWWLLMSLKGLRH